EAIAKSPDIQQKWLPLREAHLAFVELVRKKSVVDGRVVFVDLTEQAIDVVGKFVTYALFPKSVYSVIVSRGHSRCKLSIGYNPWCGEQRTHDISVLCKRHGGGGHAVVGAVTLGIGEVEKAKQIGLEMVRELNV